MHSVPPHAHALTSDTRSCSAATAGFSSAPSRASSSSRRDPISRCRLARCMGGKACGAAAKVPPLQTQAHLVFPICDFAFERFSCVKDGSAFGLRLGHCGLKRSRISGSALDARPLANARETLKYAANNGANTRCNLCNARRCTLGVSDKLGETNVSELELGAQDRCLAKVGILVPLDSIAEVAERIGHGVIKGGC